ncbi:hypothetical protein BRADI_2g06410v3 [Brachypodium distachyon]|uniref:Uncharacterized protein n=1 Tax=Brachypodium distachyon TaxID=15368 RepID=A0A0Q3FY38_BRADI|nr:hypothetical protein BRADI_2g06410v3 [Brachypodium distachyon]
MRWRCSGGFTRGDTCRGLTSPRRRMSYHPTSSRPRPSGSAMITRSSPRSDLKKLALFGCPSVERRTVFASKRLRSFFNIPEDKICSSCKIRSSCQFVNQEVPRHHKVILSDTMRILTLFVLDACPQQLQVTAELKASVCKLLKDTMNLSSIFDKPIV